MVAGRSDFALATTFGEFWGEPCYPLFIIDTFMIERSPLQLKQYLNVFYTYDVFSWCSIILSYALTSAIMCIACYAFQSGRSFKVRTIFPAFHNTDHKARNIPSQESILHINFMNFGIAFQEYHMNVKLQVSHLGTVPKLRFIWVVATFFFVMSFQSQLRSRYHFLTTDGEQHVMWNAFHISVSLQKTMEQNQSLCKK